MDSEKKEEEKRPFMRTAKGRAVIAACACAVAVAGGGLAYSGWKQADDHNKAVDEYALSYSDELEGAAEALSALPADHVWPEGEDGDARRAEALKAISALDASLEDIDANRDRLIYWDGSEAKLEDLDGRASETADGLRAWFLADYKVTVDANTVADVNAAAKDDLRSKADALNALCSLIDSERDAAFPGDNEDLATLRDGAANLANEYAAKADELQKKEDEEAAAQKAAQEAAAAKKRQSNSSSKSSSGGSGYSGGSSSGGSTGGGSSSGGNSGGGSSSGGRWIVSQTVINNETGRHVITQWSDGTYSVDGGAPAYDPYW